MTDNETSRASVIFKSAAELAFVAGLVFGIGWGGMRLAEAHHQQPVPAGEDGVIRLDLRTSSWRNATFVEEHYWHGSWHCEGDWEISWRCTPATPGEHEVSLELSCPKDQAGGEIEVRVGDHAIKRSVPSTGSELKFQTIAIGRIDLASGPQGLAVRPVTPGGTNLNLRSVTLKPAGKAPNGAK